MPPCPSRIHINKLFVPPKIYFCPPSPRYPGAGPAFKYVELTPVCDISNHKLVVELFFKEIIASELPQP